MVRGNTAVIAHWLRKAANILTALALAFVLISLPISRSIIFDQVVVPLVSGKTPYWEVGAEKMLEGKTVLDIRSPEEFAVSHLPGATLVAYQGFEVGSLPKNLEKADTILLYCSVGYRSDLVGGEMRRAGYNNVYNLKGGLFAWANKGRGLISGEGQLVKRAHPYDGLWGFWLWGAEKVEQP